MQEKHQWLVLAISFQSPSGYDVELKHFQGNEMEICSAGLLFEPVRNWFLPDTQAS